MGGEVDTKCFGFDCKNKYRCLRYTADSGDMQVYFNGVEPPYRTKTDCDFFVKDRRVDGGYKGTD